MNLGRMLEESCRQYPDHVAVIYENLKLTYTELNRDVNALGNHLKSLGIQKGDKVALMLPNCPEFVISYFAILKIGAVVVTLNAMSTAYELHYLLGNSDAKALITTLSLTKRFEEIKADLPLCRHLIATGGLQNNSPFREALTKNSADLDIPVINEEDPAAMIYTSGLTGKPLGAVLTHHNLLSQSTLLKSEVGGMDKDRCLAVIPFFHSFGACANMVNALRIGASMVLMDRFTLDSIFSTIEKEKVTYIAAVPRLFLGMIFHDKADSYNIRSLRFCITGGSAMAPEFIPLFKEKFGVLLVEGYGLTEASPICTVGRLDMPLKPGSIGFPIPGDQARVVDDVGCELPRGEVGELIFKGENVMKGYYKDEVMTAQVIKDGWLYTGDLAKINGDGYIFLMGRKKRMVITSGFNVYPREVEIVLEMHPAVKQALVVSKPDLMRGEIVKAFIVSKPGMSADEKAIMKHCRTYLSSYKIPREIEFVEKLEE
jgi:long-chain acyl-CoA synthetase